jgi:hypothetical protein
VRCVRWRDDGPKMFDAVRSLSDPSVMGHRDR